MDINLLATISNKLVSNKSSLAVAESVTAGLLQNWLSLTPNATCFFEGGITAYNLEQKCRLLQVDEQEAQKSNCVSALVANQMARHVTQYFNCDYGLATTGYAAPVPEKNVYDLHAFYAISYRQHILAEGMLCTNATTPADAQQYYALQLLAIFNDLLPWQTNKAL